MRSNPSKPSLVVRRWEEMPLSGAALAELMRAVLDKGAPFRFRARGFSMGPFIRDGDVITLVPIKPNESILGQVVAFLRPDLGEPVVHRVICSTAKACLIQGDSLPGSPDGWIPREEVLGRVSRVEREGRRVRLGLGPERSLIALLSRKGLLMPLLSLARPLSWVLARRPGL